MARKKIALIGSGMIGGTLDVSRGDDKGTVVTCIFARDL